MKGLTTDELKALVRSVGTHRGERPLSPTEVSVLLHKAIAAGETRRSCGETIGLGQTLVATFLRLRNLAPEIQHLADWGTSTKASIAFSSSGVLARLSPEEQREAAQAILQYQLTGAEVVQLVQIAQRSGQYMGECIERVLKLRPEVEVQYLLVGAITSQDLRRALAGVLQKERDRRIQEVLDDLIGGRAEVRCRLGVSGFTVTSNTNVTELLSMRADGFEDYINKALASRGSDDDTS